MKNLAGYKYAPQTLAVDGKHATDNFLNIMYRNKSALSYGRKGTLISFDRTTDLNSMTDGRFPSRKSKLVRVNGDFSPDSKNETRATHAPATGLT
jgi:hypothetical protein